MPPGRFTPPLSMNRRSQNFPQMGMGPSQFRRQPGMMGQPQRGMSPFGGGFQNNGMRARGPGRSGGGGILSRLFQKSGGTAAAGNRAAGTGAANALTGFQRAGQGGGGILSGLTNPGTIQSFLGNTQSLLKTAGQIGPMIQQYGPLMRNLPAMWRLYRGLKSVDFSEEQSEDTSNTNSTEEDSVIEGDSVTDKEKTNKPVSEKRRKKKEPSNSESDSAEKPAKGSSKPKLYI
ncbi:VrrA/YqfQ family protein [Falsibacillus pallidus]|uniref:VrrA/YqfQ family protein n=1 Tax=Falsibacillus pallidus TaxID=493781 RepID=UPI003D98E7FD